MGFQDTFSLIFDEFWVHFGVKRDEKKVPEGIDFLDEKWLQKKSTKNRNKSSPGGYNHS